MIGYGLEPLLGTARSIRRNVNSIAVHGQARCQIPARIVVSYAASPKTPTHLEVTSERIMIMTTGKHKPENYPNNLELIGIPCVLDSNGVFWFYFKDEKRITVVDKDGNPEPGGYWCENLEDGIWYLKQDGFIMPDNFITIFDNEGETVDRYTVYIGRDGVTDIYSMSDNPSHPQGVNQYSHTVQGMEPPEAHDDDIEIGFPALPEKVQDAIRERCTE